MIKLNHELYANIKERYDPWTLSFNIWDFEISAKQRQCCFFKQ